MKKISFLHISLILAIIIGLAALFYLPYQNVKEKTIANFNKEQLLLARQTSRGIQSTFTMFSKGLQYLATHPSIIHLDESGKSMLQDFYAIHTPGIVFAGRLDRKGNVIFRVSDSNTLPDETLAETFADIPQQPKKPVVSDIFYQGQMLAAFSCPVYDNEKQMGSVVFVISFNHLMQKFISPLKGAQQRRTWVINQNGIVLDCPNPAHSGAHITEATKSSGSSSLLAVMKEMSIGHQGAGAFTFRDEQGSGNQPVQNHVVFMPIELPGGNHWSVAVATPEQQVFANMKQFRNNWLLVSFIVMGTLIGLGLFLVRTITTANEEKKRQSYEDQLVELMDFTPIGIVVYDIRGTLLYANNTAKEMWRQSTAADFKNVNIFDIIHPGYKSFITQRFKDVMRGNASDPAIIKVLLPGNIEKSIEISTAPFQFCGQRCGVSVIQDVTKRLKSGEEQRLLATAIANTNDSIVITNHGGNIEYINPAFTRITGYTREEAIGQNPRILHSGHHDKIFYKNMWETIKQGRIWEGRLVNRKKDKTLYTELASISPVRDTTGEITHFVAVKRDISHEVKLKSQLNQAQKMEAIGTLAGGIAHDFNNILGAIIGFTDLSLRQLPPESPVHDNLLHIRSSGKRAADLIQQILTFSRQTTQQDKIPVAVVPLIKETLKLLRASIPTTIDIQFNLTEREGWVLADPVQIQQIIMNLCTNAFHAMSDHGGNLTIILKKMAAGEHQIKRTFPASSCIELKVSDTGKGIDKAIIERIFDPFFTTKEPGVGTGMGLSVVHGIIQDLQGTITVDSAPTGTTFTVLLPETRGPDIHEYPEKSDLHQGTESILIVDDEQDIRETSQRMLEEVGYRVTVCEKPKTALQMIRDPENPFDLVITDQTMPDMTGVELLREILQSHPDLPVIICTGFSEQITEEKAIQLGARQLLKKPFNYRQLTDCVRQVLNAS